MHAWEQHCQDYNSYIPESVLGKPTTVADLALSPQSQVLRGEKLLEVSLSGGGVARSELSALALGQPTPVACHVQCVPPPTPSSSDAYDKPWSSWMLYRWRLRQEMVLLDAI